ncbi:major facilitator superfamily domain-containing protein [Calycina marina]|uniref:Major facilitator superfamily domain-containing protein n=1 Tax=Calycina marina TaxID=1763456 RepID=A0A9P8CDB9_9HELO|nr:major facilitator superfamily domain-containing protein [Calycina marina]
MFHDTEKVIPDEHVDSFIAPVQPKPNRVRRTSLGKKVARLDKEDAEWGYRGDARCNGMPAGDSSLSSVDSPPKTVIHWNQNDPENPYNWSFGRKIWIVFSGGVIVLNSTMGSSLPSNAIPDIMLYFNVTTSIQKSLPISMFLVGYVLGPLLWGPLSESFGRKLIMIWSFFFFTIFTIGCAVAPNWTSLIVFRLFVGIFAACPNSIIGAIYADVYDDPVLRGRAIAVFVGATAVGPLVSQLISGYTTIAAGWRWTFWLGSIFAGATWVPLAFFPETFGPKLLTVRAKKLRKTTGNENVFAPAEQEKKGWKQLVTVVLTRPLRMMFFKFIVTATCLYLSAAYGIFYMFFQAYPIIFQGVYHQNIGVSGLMFLPIAVGGLIATVTFLYYDHILHKSQARNKPWTRKEESRRSPLACFGGPLFVVALFWLGWSAREEVPFWVPMVAGLPFGIGFILLFMAMINYITDAYEIFAESALSAAACSRPFTLLASLSLALCFVPFVFIWKGEQIRARSKFCQFLKMKKQEELEERERQWREAVARGR